MTIGKLEDNTCDECERLMSPDEFNNRICNDCETDDEEKLDMEEERYCCDRCCGCMGKEEYEENPICYDCRSFDEE